MSIVWRGRRVSAQGPSRSVVPCAGNLVLYEVPEVSLGLAQSPSASCRSGQAL
jgi:hypothetical protein